MLKIDSIHEMEEYLGLLSTSLTIYMDGQRLDAAYEDACYAADDAKWLTLLALRIESGGLYSSVNADNLLDYLARIGVDIDKRCLNRRSKSYSLDLKKVVTPLIESGIAVNVLSAYKEYRSNSSYSSALAKLANRRIIHGHTSDGRTIMKFPTHVEERDNMRAYYSDIAVVSVPKKYSNVITGPDDKHFLGWCDYPQADWRFAYNLFIRDEESDEVMRNCEDAYEGLARLVEGDAFDAEKFKTTRKEFKVHCLSIFYNSSNTAPIPTAIRNYFRSRPKYKRMLYDLDVLYRFKLPIPCTSYFGFTQLLPEASYPAEFTSKGLNTPIQTFTSHVVNETVFGVLDKFWSMGYTPDDINIYYVRHDEPIFMMTPAVIKDAWVFKECSDIYIPGFTPIHLDFHFGRYYKEDDPRITEDITSSIQASDHVYDLFSDDDFADKIKHDYYPLPSVESIYVQFYVNEETNGLHVCMYNYRNGERKIFQSPHRDQDDALHYALEQGGALDWLGNPQYLLVRNSGLDFMDHVGANEETLMKVIDRYDSSVAGMWR